MSVWLEPPPVYFMHIPKTAGTSVRKILRSAYAGRAIAILEVPLLYRYASPDLPKFCCYLSHCGPSMLKSIGRSDLLLATMLREPVERTISALYFHQDNLTKHPDWFEPDHLENQSRFIGVGLDVMLADSRVVATIEDAQTKLLGVEKDYGLFLADGAIGRTGQGVRVPYHVPTIGDPHDMSLALRQAQQQLDRMAVVGLTERFAESVTMLCDWLGIPQLGRPPTERIGAKKSTVDINGYRATLPPELIEQVQNVTRYDRELYAYARELFEQQWTRYQVRPRRTYSIAAHLRHALRPVKARVKRVIQLKRA